MNILSVSVAESEVSCVGFVIKGNNPCGKKSLGIRLLEHASFV